MRTTHPISVTRSRRSVSRSSRSASCSWRRHRARSEGSSDQAEVSNASRALAIARSTSSIDASAASPTTCPLAGSTTGNVAPDAAGTSSPRDRQQRLALDRRVPDRLGVVGDGGEQLQQDACGRSPGRRPGAHEATGAPSRSRAPRAASSPAIPRSMFSVVVVSGGPSATCWAALSRARRRGGRIPLR